MKQTPGTPPHSTTRQEKAHEHRPDPQQGPPHRQPPPRQRSRTQRRRHPLHGCPRGHRGRCTQRGSARRRSPEDEEHRLRPLVRLTTPTPEEPHVNTCKLTIDHHPETDQCGADMIHYAVHIEPIVDLPRWITSAATSQMYATNSPSTAPPCPFTTPSPSSLPTGAW